MLVLACGETVTDSDTGTPTVDVGTLPDLGQDPDVSEAPDLHFDLAETADANDTSTDETPPALAFTSPADGALVTGEIVQVTLIATDSSGIASVEVWLNDEELGTQNEEPFEFVVDGLSLPSGAHRLRAVAADGAGNQTETSIGFDFEQPCAEPPCSPVEIRWLSPRNVDTICRSVRLEVLLIPEEVVDVVDYELDGEALGSATEPPWSYEWESRDSPDGLYVLSATTTRGDGRQATVSRELTVANRGQDCALPPTVEFVSPEPDLVTGGPISILLSLSESATEASLFVDGSFATEMEVSRPEFEIETSGFPEGRVDLRAVAADARGRSADAETAVTIDRTPPDLTVLSPFGGTYEETVLLAADVFDAGGIQEVLWYDAANTTAEAFAGEVVLEGAGPIADGGTDGRAELDASAWPSGQHEVIAVARDRAGWSTMDTASFVIDRPPTLEVLGPPTGSRVEGATVLTVQVIDDAGPVELSLWHGDAEVWNGEIGERAAVAEVVEIPWIPAFAEGVQTLRIDALDRSAGESSISAEYDVNHAPRLEVLLCQEGCLQADDVDEIAGVILLSVTATDDGEDVTSVSLSVDDELITAVTAPPFSLEWDSAGAANGSHTLRITAVTEDGEEGTWSATYETAN